MKKVIFETLLGLVLSVVGFGGIFYGLTVSNGGMLSFVFIGVGFVAVCIGVFLLYKAGTKDVQKPNFSSMPIAPESGEKKSILEKNQELVNDYNKTMRARDKLKILKMSATVDEN